MRYDNPIGKTFIVLVLFAFLISTSCSSSKLVNSAPEVIQGDLKVGDFVKVVTKDDRQLEFEIVKISSGLLFSAYQVIPLAEIKKVEIVKRIKEPESTEKKAKALLKYLQVAAGIIFVIAIGIALYK